jgi:DNA polymerase
MTQAMDAATALAWQVAMGADEAIGDAPRDLATLARMQAASAWLKQAAPAPSPPPAPAAPRPVVSRAAAPAAPAASRAQALADAATTLDELRDAIRTFDGLAIRDTATNLVFADGDPRARLMVIGEAPGADEDREGKPFVGRSGQLLDRMLASVGFFRAPRAGQQGFYITNLVTWRPPGNRNPTDAEIALSLPFLRRHIALARPALLLLAGGVSAKALTGRSDGVLRLRGKWFDIEVAGLPQPVSALATLHPAYLLRSPGAKREAWADMLALRTRWDVLRPEVE